jgi:DNA-binding CsgD family transcriptional regulator
VGETWGELGAVVAAAACAVDLRDSGSAAQLVGAADAIAGRVGAVPIPDWWLELVYAREAAQGALGQVEFDAACALGRATPLIELVAAASRMLADREALSGRGLGPSGLTPREVEVLELLAQRYSNREIANALVLSVRTVERHIGNIYAKTGIGARREAAEYWRRHVAPSPGSNGAKHT